MKKKSSIAADLILSFGSLVFLGLTIIAILKSQREHSLIFNFLPIAIIASGIPLCILGIHFTRKMHHIFMGFELVFWGVYLCLLMSRVLPFRFVQFWPVIGVTAGIFLYIAGIVCYHKIKLRYFIPALALFLMGIWFLFFSFGIIKVPFRVVAIVGGPLFFIMTGMFIIIFFMLQKKYTNLVVPEEDEGGELEAEDTPENDKSDE